MVKYVDNVRDIENWYAVFEGTLLIASRISSKQISSIIRQSFPDLKFIVIEIDPKQKAGWLPRSVWNFLNDPHAAAESA